MKGYCLMCDDKLPETNWDPDICALCIELIEEADYNDARAQMIEEERKREC